VKWRCTNTVHLCRTTPGENTTVAFALQRANINSKANWRFLVRKDTTLCIGTHHFSAFAMCSWASLIFWAAILLVNSMRYNVLSILAMDVASSMMFGLPKYSSSGATSSNVAGYGCRRVQKTPVTRHWLRVWLVLLGVYLTIYIPNIYIYIYHDIKLSTFYFYFLFPDTFLHFICAFVCLLIEVTWGISDKPDRHIYVCMYVLCMYVCVYVCMYVCSCICNSYRVGSAGLQYNIYEILLSILLIFHHLLSSCIWSRLKLAPSIQAPTLMY